MFYILSSISASLFYDTCFTCTVHVHVQYVHVHVHVCEWYVAYYVLLYCCVKVFVIVGID